VWIENQKRKATTEQEDDKDTAQIIVQRLSIAKKRMERGLCLLSEDKLASTSFSMANEAMLHKCSPVIKIKVKQNK
jgi:hypothetical protein